MYEIHLLPYHATDSVVILSQSCFSFQYFHLKVLLISRIDCVMPPLIPTLPLLVVLGLDYVLWPFWVNNQVTPPFRKNETGVIVDFWGKEVTYYNDSLKVLQFLHDKSIQIAAVSNNVHDDGTNHLLELFEFDKFFAYKEFYPGIITDHFEEIRKRSRVRYSDMLYFDDSNISIEDMRKLGVYGLELQHGLDMYILENGLKAYQKQKEKSTKE